MASPVKLFSRPFHAPQWHEGLLLGAQHFQQADFYQHMLLQHHVLGLSPYQWGLYSLEIDHAALVMGSLRVLACQAFMPDGTLINYDANDQNAEELVCPFQDMGEVLVHKPLKIYLTLAPMPDGHALRAPADTRYRVHFLKQRVDIYTQDNPWDIPVLHPKLTLVTEKQLHAQSVVLPLVEIGVQDDAYALTSFIPPTVQVRHQDPLGILCLEILTYLKEKSVLLADRLQSPSLPPSLEPLYHAQLKALMPALIPFEALLYGTSPHPFAAYMALTGLLGHLATLRPQQVLREVPRYDHMDIRPVLENIFGNIKKYADDIGGRCQRIPFSEEGKGFSLKRQDRIAGDVIYVALRPGAGLSEGEAKIWMDEAIIATSHALADVRDRRTLGALRTKVETMSEEYGAPPVGMLTYQIRLDERFISFPGELKISNPSMRQKPDEMVLMIQQEFYTAES